MNPIKHVGLLPFLADGDAAKGPPDVDKIQSDMRNNLLSDIEDYCILFGTDALPALRDYLSQATAGWTKRPDPGLVEGER